MPDKDGQPTKEEVREVALKNLKSALGDLAVAYQVQISESYGKAGGDAVYNHLYTKARGSEEGNALTNKILRDNSGGLRYGGSVSEAQIISSAYSTIKNSLGLVKVSDVMQLLGSKEKIDPKYKDAYMSDLLGENADEQLKQIGQMVMQTYMGSRTDAKFGEAFAMNSRAGVGQLEQILKPAEKPKK